MRPTGAPAFRAFLRHRSTLVPFLRQGGLRCTRPRVSLPSVGIFALVSYSVGQRQREFGIRAALGARAGTIVMLAVRQGVRLTAIGIGLGLLISFGLTRFMAGLPVGAFLIEVHETDRSVRPTSLIRQPSLPTGGSSWRGPSVWRQWQRENAPGGPRTQRYRRPPSWQLATDWT